MIEYSIKKKEQFTVIGKSRTFNEDTSYNQIPVFWNDYLASKDIEVVKGAFGICFDSNGETFDYMIADVYLPWQDIPKGFQTRVIPAGMWAVFPCRGALPKALQDVNTKIWNEWLPAAKSYELAGNYNIEMYAPPCERAEDTYSEIWIPVKCVETK